MGQLAKTETNLISFLKEVDLLEVKLLAKTAKAVFFDLGKYGTGVVYGAELSNARDIIKA